MHVESAYIFSAPIDHVWNLLTDPANLSGCIPGCETFEPQGADEYAVVLKVGVAAIKGTYTGRVKIAEQEPPRLYKLLIDGTGAPGFVRGEGTILLESSGDQTIVTVVGDAQIGGTIASVGQRMLGGVAKMLLNQFFTCLQKHATAEITARQ